MSIYWLVFTVILASGLLGGLMNYCLSSSTPTGSDMTVDRSFAWWKHLVVGVGSAFMVPLFLNTISADLLSRILVETSPDYTKLYVLAGFGVLSAVLSTRFIDSLSQSILRQLNQVETKVDQTIRANEEPEMINRLPTRESSQELDDLDDNEKKVLRAFQRSRIVYRSKSGLTKDSDGLTRSEVDKAVESLIQKELVKEGLGSKGTTRWYLLPEGRRKAVLLENE